MDAGEIFDYNLKNKILGLLSCSFFNKYKDFVESDIARRRPDELDEDFVSDVLQGTENSK